MEPKKNPKADIEKQRSTYTLIGLVFALAVTIVAFTWKTYDDIVVADLGDMDVIIDEEIIPITQRQPRATPPPPPPKPQEIINVVEDEVELEEELEIESIETDETEEVQVVEQEGEESNEIMMFERVESKPVFPGCEKESNEEARSKCFQSSVMRFISSNFKFPETARRNGIQGTVFVEFVVEKDGSLSNIRAVRSVHKLLDDEAIRVVSEMGKRNKFIPAKQRGKPVRIRFTVPIRATLN